MRGLEREGALGAIDVAVSAVRAGAPATLLGPVAGGGLVAAVLLLALYAERVEGVSGLRLLFGGLLVLAFWARAILATKAARRAALVLWPTLRVGQGSGRPLDTIRTASVVALGLAPYLALFAVASRLSVVLALVLFPVLALRGLVAPSWLARASFSERGGVGVFVAAAGDNSGRRLRGFAIESLLLLGTIGLAINLYALIAVGLLLARSMFGIDVTAIDAFISLRNPIVSATILAAAMSLFEPLRAAISAHAYVDASVRKEGLDLLAAVRNAERTAESGRRRARGARAGGSVGGIAASAALAFALSPAGARAQSLPDDDDEARARALEILAQPEFAEHELPEGVGLEALLRRLFEWLLAGQDTPDLGMTPGFALPLPPTWVFIVAGAVLLLAVGLFVWVTRRRGVSERAESNGGDEVASDDPFERPPEAHLDDAAALAAAGQHRDALRSLYVATLVALDRRRMITFDPSRTNWHYLRELPMGEGRADFTRFTTVFDHKWYGDETATVEDYRLCRDLADRIVESTGAP